MEEVITAVIAYLTADWLRTYVYCAVLYSVLCVSDIVNTPWSVYNTTKREDTLANIKHPELMYMIFMVYLPSAICSVFWPIGLIKRIIRRSRYTIYLIGVYLFKRPRNYRKEMLKWHLLSKGDIRRDGNE